MILRGCGGSSSDAPLRFGAWKYCDCNERTTRNMVPGPTSWPPLASACVAACTNASRRSAGIGRHAFARRLSSDSESNGVGIGEALALGCGGFVCFSYVFLDFLQHCPAFVTSRGAFFPTQF